MMTFCAHCGQHVPLAKRVRAAIGKDDTHIDFIKSKMPLDIEDKEIYNALGYLTRKKLIKRVGHGLYRNR